MHLNAPRDIVAQWLTQWSYMREVPGSIPIHVTCLFHHFISYGEVANSSLFLQEFNITIKYSFKIFSLFQIIFVFKQVAWAMSLDMLVFFNKVQSV